MIEFGFIGHCFSIAQNHDKIWGYFYRPTETEQGTTRYWVKPIKEDGWNVTVFWGRLGGAIQFKSDISGWALRKLIRTKTKNGYVSIDANKLLEMWPSFTHECEEKLVWDTLAGKIK